jgi:hypothetical protein
MTGQLNSFTHLRALLVLQVHSILGTPGPHLRNGWGTIIRVPSDHQMGVVVMDGCGVSDPPKFYISRLGWCGGGMRPLCRRGYDTSLVPYPTV